MFGRKPKAPKPEPVIKCFVNFIVNGWGEAIWAREDECGMQVYALPKLVGEKGKCGRCAHVDLHHMKYVILAHDHGTEWRTASKAAGKNTEAILRSCTRCAYEWYERCEKKLSDSEQKELDVKLQKVDERRRSKDKEALDGDRKKLEEDAKRVMGY